MKEDKVQRRLQQESGGRAVTWEEVASTDKRLLRALFNSDVYFQRSPNDLWAASRGGDEVAHKELVSMVAVANGYLAYRRFRVLRYVTPMAAAIVLVGGLAWKPLTAPMSESPTSASPLPVVVTLAPGISGNHFIGSGCTLRVLNGVAVAGKIESVVTVAFAPQGDCPATVINVNPADAAVRPR